jgi:hypothetical protein
MQKTIFRRKITSVFLSWPTALMLLLFVSTTVSVAQQMDAGKYFIFHYSQFPPPQVLKHTANETYLAAQQELKTEFTRPISVFLHHDIDSFRRATGTAWWIAGMNISGQIHLQSTGVLQEKGLLVSTIRHEIWLTFIERAATGLAPPWLAEGLALVRSGEAARLSSISKSDYQPADLAGIDKILLSRQSRDKALAAYLVCIKLVRQLEDSCAEGAAGIVLALGKGTELTSALAEQCNLNPDQLWEATGNDER